MSRQCVDASRQCLNMSKQCLDVSLRSQLLSVAPLHSLGHNDQNEVTQDFFTHMMPLAPALLSCDANCFINSTIFSLDEDN